MLRPRSGFAVILISSVALMLSTGSAQSPESAEVTDPRLEATLVARIKSDANRQLGLRKSEVARVHVPLVPEQAFETYLPIDGREVTLRLWEHSVRGEDFELRVHREDGTYELLDPGPVRTIRGEVVGIPNAKVAGRLSDEGLEAMIMMPDGGKRWVEPLVGRSVHADIDHHVIYDGSDVIETAGTCHAIETEEHVRREQDRGGIIINQCYLEVCVAEIAIDADAEYLAAHGTPEEAENAIEAVINTVNLQYEAEVKIQHQIVTTIIRTDPGHYLETDPVGLLTEFRLYWEASHQDVDRDVVHLFTGKEIDGNVIGIAYLAAVCTPMQYGLSQSDCCDGFAYSTDLTAHELGHNWDADHCDCLGWTMNPFIQAANRFHPQFTVPDIENYRSSIDCLYAGSVGRTGLPLIDSFETQDWDREKWAQIEGVEINTQGNNEPSPPYSVNIDGSDVLQTSRLNADLSTQILLRYQWQRRGGGDAPEAGDDLVVEYNNSSGDWVEIRRHLGSGATLPGYTQENIMLPSNAEHANLQVRFKGVAPINGFDDWFIDNVSITAQPALPGPFVLQQPANGEHSLQFPIGFNWSDSNRASIYILQVDDDPAFQSPEVELPLAPSTWELESSDLAPATLYYWRVEARNGNGSQMSTPASRSFVTTIGPPGPFELSAPIGGELVTTMSPTFQWTGSTHATEYYLTLDDSPDLSSPIASVILGPAALQWTPAPDMLTNDVTYYWKVRASNIVGEIVASPNPGSFTTAVPAGCPGDADGNGSVNVGDISFVVFRLGEVGGPADVDDSGAVNVGDISFVVFRLGPCP